MRPRGKQAFTLKGHTGYASSVCFSPDGKRIASGSYDQTVKVWDAHRERSPHLQRTHGGVNSVCFSPDGKRLASGSWDHTVKVWAAHTRQQPLILTGHTGRHLQRVFQSRTASALPREAAESISRGGLYPAR